jgi:hypothetical protein
LEDQRNVTLDPQRVRLPWVSHSIVWL